MIFIGDIHGNFQALHHQIEFSDIKNETLIQVGDFGIGFKPDVDMSNLKRLNTFLCNRNISLHVIRGNHDKPSYFDGDWNFTNIRFLPDYSILHKDGLNILFIGGAISIDRVYREEDKNYWKDEVFRLDIDFLKGVRNINTVVTHSAPMFCDPVGIKARIVDDFISVDNKLKDDLIKERTELSWAYNILNESNNIKQWIYGHFHASNRSTLNNINFVGLNINEFYKI
jgi:predicted phosphodiesterase